jgi:C-terminal processing protease CtpA/Prc
MPLARAQDCPFAPKMAPGSARVTTADMRSSILAASILLSALPGCFADSAKVRAHEADLAAPCVHLMGGPKGMRSIAADLGRAHALVRYFGPEASSTDADARLVDVLAATAPTSDAAVEAYAQKFESTCAAPAEASTLGSARVEMNEAVAILTPGRGDVTIPHEAKAIALDLRSLPQTEDAREAIDRALERILHGDVAALAVEERTCNGQPDEYLIPDHDLYGCRVVAEKKPALLHGRAETVRPIAVLTAPRMTPLAARAAITLRARANAFVVGAPVSAAVAESTWIGIGDKGIAVRTRRLLLNAKTAVPDVVDADVSSDDAVAALASIDWTVARAALAGSATRTPIVDLPRAAQILPFTPHAGDARAAVVTAYAALRTFFPYFDAVDDTLDERLEESLAAVETSDARATVNRALARLTAVLNDSHVFPSDFGATATAAPLFAPVALLPLGEDLVVARSITADAAVGDVVVSIDGVAASERLAEQMALFSGSPQTVRRRASGRLLASGRPVQLEVRTATGKTRSVTLNPTPQRVAVGLFEHPAGTLDDLGAPDLYYVSLNAAALEGADVAAMVDAMQGKRGVILDMRGYPNRTAWQILSNVVGLEAPGPRMGFLNVRAETRSVVDDFAQTTGVWSHDPQRYTGPVIMLTDTTTLSQAEHLTTFYRSSNRGKVLGGRTAGANGEITSVQLPGGYGFSFTGMIVRNPDGTVFHGRGVVPDIEVVPTPADLRAGRDAMVIRAIDELR